jgi:hypothetical protein
MALIYGAKLTRIVQCNLVKFSCPSCREAEQYVLMHFRSSSAYFDRFDTFQKQRSSFDAFQKQRGSFNAFQKPRSLF